MSLSPQAVELYTLLVDETYGELTSRIFTILLRRGRLPIIQLCKHTGLGARKIRHGLTVLLQQNLAYYNEDEDTGITHYEANPDAAYHLVRSGKIMDIVEGRFGGAARDVMENLLLLGHTKVADLTEAYQSKQKTNINDNGHSTKGANDQSKYSVTSTSQLHTILTELLQVGYLEPVSERMFHSPTDTYNKFEQEILARSPNARGAKEKIEQKRAIQNRLQELRDERTWKPTNNKKRPLNGDLGNGINGSNKRRRLSNGNGAIYDDRAFEDDGTRLDPDLVVRINSEKFTVALRNQVLVEHARDRIGETTSQIYAELLRLMEDKIPRCRLDPKIDEPKDPNRLPFPTVTSAELAAAIGESIDPSAGIGKDKSANADKTSTKSPKFQKRIAANGNADEDEPDQRNTLNNNKDATIVDDIDDDPFTSPKPRQRVTFQENPSNPAAERENRVFQVKNHLELLMNDECVFVRHCGTRGLGEWAVDFDLVVKHMQEAELDAMLLESYGTSGHRLGRMLRKHGKLDEKQLPNMALLSQKAIRTKLAEMQMAGVVDIQEVPKDAAYTNQRTIFLWYFDTERVSTILVNDYYKAMSRCLQRLEIEKRRAHEALAPTLRSDTQGQLPEEYLEGNQLSDYQEIIGKEEALLGELGRLDDLVGIFRDF